ncbi:MAG: dTMP kinase [Rubricoccaceae bacterium]
MPARGHARRARALLAYFVALSPLSHAVFISFEGLDGSGKSTQAGLLAAALRAEGHDVLLLREPGGTALGERVRAFLLGPEAPRSARAELFLFCAARAELTETVIRPALARGAVVIADRFVDSTTAYQGAGRGLGDEATFAALHDLATQGCLPQRTFLLELSVTEAMARCQARGEKDCIEHAGAAFFEAVRARYRALAQAHPERIVPLKATLAPEALHACILARVRPLLSAPATVS